MSKHTPGRWRLERGMILHPTRDIALVAICWPGSQAERDANARLVAAASQLHAALVAAMAFIDSHCADPDLSEEMVTNWQALHGLAPHDLLASLEAI